MKTMFFQWNKTNRRKNAALKLAILAAAISLAQFFGLWYIHLAMTTVANELQWTPLVFQLLLNFCFTFLLISMAGRSFHLERMVLSVQQSLAAAKQDRRFTEANLRLSRDRAEAASKAKTDYLAFLSHELRTPMSAIVGFSELLINESLNEEQQDYAQTVYLNSKHLLGLINNVLDLSKIEAGKLELVRTDFSLAALIRQIDAIVRPMVETKGLRFEVETDGDVPDEINTDEIRLRQCLINLLNNAVKFTGAGSVRLTVRASGSGVCFEVSDTGIGIPEDKLVAVFDPFVQADKTTSCHFGGTGLGLAITRQLIELMGGAVTVRSDEGRGTAFTLHLPAACAAQTPV